MFALRTPTKKENASRADATQKAQSPSGDVDDKNTGKMPAEEIVTQNDTYTVETQAPKQKYANRLIEAKACVTKAKIHLENSRNTKNTIKTEVTNAIDRLYQLIKEAEQEIKNLGKESQEPTIKEPIVKKPQTDTENLGAWMGVMRAEINNMSEAIQELTSPTPLKCSGNINLGQVIKEIKNLRTDIEAHSNRANGKMTALQEEIKTQASVTATTMPNLSTNHTKSIDRLVEEVQELRQKTEQTYASVVGSRPTEQTMGRTTLHSVIVTSKDETETGDEVLEKLRMAVDAKEGWVKIEKVRKGKDRKIIVGLKTKEEREKFKEKLGRDGALNVEEIQNKDPLVILKDILHYNSDEDILNALRKQNLDMFKGLEKNENKTEIAYKKRTRNPHTSHIVMRVSPKIWQRMVDAEYVHIDLQRVRVADQSPLVQCSLCLGYGHGRRFCKETTEKCCHCGGPHMRNECPNWRTGAMASCCNCTNAKIENANHNAFSNECTIRKKWDALARATIAYC